METRHLKVICVLLLFGSMSFAAEAKKNKAGKVLDFNADIIEGEVKRPEMLLEVGTDVKDLSSVLYIREDFNDFHAVDMASRLKLIESVEK